MADLRVIVFVLAGCGSAGAQPEPVSTASVTPPQGWQVLPAAATAATAAAGAPGIVVDHMQAWGEPTAGCYALWFALHGGSGGSETIAKEIVDGLAAEKFVVGDPAVADGMFELAIERAPYKGRVRARVGDGKLAGIACVANQRDPASCETPCKTMLGAVQ